MFIDDLTQSGATPTLERLLRFTEARQNLLGDDVANVSTPGYRQRDLSLPAFQRALQAHLGDRAGAGGDDEIEADVGHPQAGILSHDGNDRSMEWLMSESAKNALMHNTVVELLRRQYQTLDMALKDRVS